MVIGRLLVMYNFYIESGEAANYEPRGCIIERKLIVKNEICVYVSVHPPIDDDYYSDNSATNHLVLIAAPLPIWPKSKEKELDFFNILESQFPATVSIATLKPNDISESGCVDISKIRVIDKGSILKSPNLS